MELLLVILIVLLLFGGVGVSPLVWSHNYGWYPSSGIGLLLLILVIVLLVRGR